MCTNNNLTCCLSTYYRFVFFFIKIYITFKKTVCEPETVLRSTLISDCVYIRKFATAYYTYINTYVNLSAKIINLKFKFNV